MTRFCLIPIMSIICLQTIQCMKIDETKLVLQVPLLEIKRTYFPANGVIIYDATFQNCTPIMVNFITSGTHKGYIGIKNGQNVCKEPLHIPTFLEKLYPACQMPRKVNGAYAPVYEHLVHTLDKEYVKRNPQEQAMLKIQE